MKQKEVSETEFEELFAQVEVEKRPGSGWFDLWLRVRHWGYEKGFSVPYQHLWGWEPDAFTCIEVGDYAGQITSGKKYKRVREDSQRNLLRIVNDYGKTRWYPLHLFERPVAPIREWIRKPIS